MLKNRRFAAGFTAVICAVSVLFGSYRSASALARGTDEPYYVGVYHKDGNYRTPPITQQLDVRISTSNSAAALLSKHEPLEEYVKTLLDVRRNLIKAEDLYTQSRLNVELTAAFDQLIAAAYDYGIDADDEDDIAYYADMMRGSQALIDESAREIKRLDDGVYDALGQFPGIIWRGENTRNSFTASVDAK